MRFSFVRTTVAFGRHTTAREAVNVIAGRATRD
jgi:hypothetical protein